MGWIYSCYRKRFIYNLLDIDECTIVRVEVSLKALLIIITYICVSTITNSKAFRVKQFMSINVTSQVWNLSGTIIHLKAPKLENMKQILLQNQTCLWATWLRTWVYCFSFYEVNICFHLTSTRNCKAAWTCTTVFVLQTRKLRLQFPICMGEVVLIILVSSSICLSVQQLVSEKGSLWNLAF